MLSNVLKASQKGKYLVSCGSENLKDNKINLLIWDLKEKKQIGKTDLSLGQKEIDDSEKIKNLFCFSDDFKKFFVRSDDKKGIKVIDLSDFAVFSEKICDNTIG